MLSQIKKIRCLVDSHFVTLSLHFYQIKKELKLPSPSLLGAVRIGVGVGCGGPNT